MPDWISIAALAVQTAMAILAVEQLRLRVLPVIRITNSPHLYVDVWIPVAIVLPFMFFVERRPEGGGIGTGWLPMAGPMACAAMSFGAALIVSRRSSVAEGRPHSMSIITIAGTGIAVLLIGAAHDLTLWMGQFAFALAAVLLWFNTPEELVDEETDSGAEHLRASRGMLLVMVASVGQGLASLSVRQDFAPISGGCMMIAATMAMTCVARLSGQHATMRIGGWIVTYGFLLAIGLLSVVRLVRESWSANEGEEVQYVHRIAFGFGAYWIEGLIVIGLTILYAAHGRVPPLVNRLVGAVLLAVAGGLAAWRISMI